ncbi:MAG: site-specific DNA-methyltransferase [Actinomycetota bacterium]
MSTRKTTAARGKKADAAGEVKIATAKGRPMLTWVGKRPLTRVTAFPAQQVETFDPSGDATQRKGQEWDDWPAAYPRGGLLFHGDNKEVLAHLLANGFRGKVDLIYIDPPFDSGADYVRRVSLRGAKGTAKLDGDAYTLGEQIQYTDIWANDNYLQFMYERVMLLRELLSQGGCIWLHCDPSRGHYLKSVMDEVFGADNYVNQVVWKRSDAHSDVGQGAKHFGTIHDMLLLYRSGTEYTWNEVFTPLPQSTVDNWYRHVEEGTGRRYNLADMSGPGGAAKGNPVYEWKGNTRAWRFSKERMKELDSEGRIVYTKSGLPYLKRYLDESKGVPLQDWWDDITMIRGIQRRETGRFPTEKPEALVRRIIEVSSSADDLVLDAFVGSGTTAAVAQKLGRRWIGCDINHGAIQTTSKRLQEIIESQLDAASQGTLVDDDATSPAQLSFTTWRVNDYDLQIQHNEAVNLACEHIGVQRSRTDRYFDGALGKSLVKIAPFTHPLSPADLDELRKELEARPDEDRNVTVVCLGIELAAQAWIEEWNRLRRGRNAINRIEVIELRTDERYGAFLAHDPAGAKVKIERKGGKIHVRIDDFISPTIVKRLAEHTGVVHPKIDDWRAMVDCVMIDASYDGEVFDIALSDVPERKTDLVRGGYELPAPGGKTTVAVKIVDMLGEEVLHTGRI